MCFKKKQPKIFKLSNDSIQFIRKYLIDELEIRTKIDEDILVECISVAFDWESLMVDENGQDRTYDYPDKQRNEMADKFVSDVSGRFSSEKWILDFEDLNKRLGLL